VTAGRFTQYAGRVSRGTISVREGALAERYRVEGFAPTSRAAQKLAEAGIDTSALQMHLARGRRPDTGEHRLSCWTNLRSFPQRCMSSSASFIEMTVSCCLVTLASTRLPRQDGRLRNFRKRALPDIMPTSKNTSTQQSSVLADHGLEADDQGRFTHARESAPSSHVRREGVCRIGPCGGSQTRKL
jgi:hypothetical protein